MNVVQVAQVDDVHLCNYGLLRTAGENVVENAGLIPDGLKDLRAFWSTYEAGATPSIIKRGLMGPMVMTLTFPLLLRGL